MNLKKIILLVLIFFTTIIVISIFLGFYYKNVKSGNNSINKSEEEIIKNILEMKSYIATMEINIQTNKNETKYIVKQILKDGKTKQEVIEPKNIAGVITEYDGNNLKIFNSKLDLETTFENYKYIVENRLWLDFFIEEYNKSKNKEKNIIGEEIILEVIADDDIYNYNKKLYIDKKTGKPIKLIIEDINKKMLVYILYTEIEIS